MKKWILLILVLALCSAACVAVADSAVVYFSCTGTTEKIAEWVAEDTGADLFRLLPKEPYTEEDLKYYTDCRADREQADDAARPEISNLPEKLGEYDVIFLGYPIWHGKAPKIMYTLLESLDFSGKTMIPFCTSASSGMGSSATLLKALTGNTTTWLDGKRFAKTAEHTDISSWVGTLNLPAWSKTIYIRVGDASVSAVLEDNPSAKAFYQLLKQGNIKIDMKDYGSFEKVGPLGTKIVQSDEKITTVPGDIILYQGDKVTVYYAPNTYTFTKLGHINGATAENTKAFLGDGDPVVEFSAEPFPKEEDTGSKETENPDEESQDLPEHTGWVNTDEGWTYISDDGTKATGWLKSGDIWYYMNAEGIMQTGWVSDGNTWYHMNSSGAMETGWVSDGDIWYYMKSSGAMATGWISESEAWYYLTSSGRMVTGWNLIDDQWYYFQPSGRMATGWLSDRGAWYYLSPKGDMTTGWLRDNGSWYYLEASGRMITGWQSIQGSWYYFKDSGKMTTGWFEDKAAEESLPESQKQAIWYWFDENGRMATGWKEISGQWEMFDEKNGQWLYTWDGN